MVFCEVGGVGGDFVGNQFLFDIFFVGQVEMFFWCDIVQYGVVELVDYCCVDIGGEMVVVWCDISGEWFQGVEWCFVVVFQLFGYIVVDYLYWYVVRVFNYYLYVIFSGDFCQFVEGVQFGKLCFIVGILNGVGVQVIVQ